MQGLYVKVHKPHQLPGTWLRPTGFVCGACLCIVRLCLTLSSAVLPSPAQLEQWNRNNIYQALNVPAALLTGSALMDGGSAGSTEPLFPLLGYDVKSQCKSPGAAVDPAQAKAGTCQYKANKDGTFTYWEKQPGDWARMSNCYCYALDVFKNSWCQPGAATGVDVDPNSMSCATLKKAIIADGAKEVTAAQALSTKAPTGHYVAMMMRPQSSCNFARCQPDFHFMRKDSNGLWSHKPGEAPAQNKDANGALIKDPKTAKISGQYTGGCDSESLIEGCIKSACLWCVCASGCMFW